MKRFSSNKSIKKLCYLLFFLIFLFFTGISGCGGNGGAGDAHGAGILPADNTGAYHLSIAWPDGAEHSRNAKIIPGGTDLVDIEISGDGLDDPIITEIPPGEEDVLIENIPVGFHIALIRAIDRSGNSDTITAQRKESFTVMAGLTSESDSVPLGVALVGSANNPVFEPSSITIACGANLYFQN